MSNSQLLRYEDPCPCQSGKAFGECCLRYGRALYQGGIPVLLVGVPPEHSNFLQHEVKRQARFGHVRPAINADWRGEKWLAVGRELFHSSKMKRPGDSLSDYVKYVMTP